MMAPLLLLVAVFGMVAGFIMGWLGGRVYGRHEGRAAALRDRPAAGPRQHEPVPVLAAPQAPPTGPVVLVVQNHNPAPAPSPAPVAGGYSKRLAELAMHLAAAEHASRCVPGEPAAITTGHTVDAQCPALHGEVA
ncbi:MAG: hypothetical protein ACR2GE_00815 [Pseudonocardia sp.]